MKIEINIEKKHLYIFSIIIFVALAGFVAVNAVVPAGSPYHTTLYTDNIKSKGYLPDGEGNLDDTVNFQSNFFEISGTPQSSLLLGRINGAQWGIEYMDADVNGEQHESGLNFWKPFGTTNYGNYKLFIADNGSVGIDTKAPTAKLDVRGDVKITGNLDVDGERYGKINLEPGKNPVLVRGSGVSVIKSVSNEWTQCANVTFNPSLESDPVIIVGRDSNTINHYAWQVGAYNANKDVFMLCATNNLGWPSGAVGVSFIVR